MSLEQHNAWARDLVCLAAPPQHDAADGRLQIRLMVGNQSGETQLGVRVQVVAIEGGATHKKLPIVLRLSNAFERGRVDIAPGTVQSFDFIKRAADTPNEASQVAICAPTPQKFGMLGPGHYRFTVRVLANERDAIDYSILLTGSGLQTVTQIEAATRINKDVAELLPGWKPAVLDFAGVRALPKKPTAYVIE